MATSQAIGRPNITDTDRHSARVAEAQRAGIWSRELDWLLNEAEAALGARGTLASVIASIERGGASGCTDDPNLSMLRRIGWRSDGVAQPGERLHRKVELAKRHGKRWHQLTAEHQRTHVAHYVATPKVDSKIRSRFGLLSGVVVQQWLESNASARRAALAPRLDELRDEQARTLAELEPLESAIRARPATRGRAGFRDRSRRAFLEPLARPLRTRLANLRAAESELLAVIAAGGTEGALRALVAACEKGEPPGLAQAAEQRVRAAHAAWEATGRVEASRWVEGA